jgi:hypothetical protein
MGLACPCRKVKRLSFSNVTVSLGDGIYKALKGRCYYGIEESKNQLG